MKILNCTRETFLKSKCDQLYKRKGSKFQNLIYFYNKIDFKRYKYIWVVDDDIELKTKKINELFIINSKYNFGVSQPSFSKNETDFSWHVITQFFCNFLSKL